jgi:prepilin-type processing-associated H-X9-DG protein
LIQDGEPPSPPPSATPTVTGAKAYPKYPALLADPGRTSSAPVRRTAVAFVDGHAESLKPSRWFWAGTPWLKPNVGGQ